MNTKITFESYFTRFIKENLSTSLFVIDSSKGKKYSKRENNHLNELCVVLFKYEMLGLGTARGKV